jgi:hypothetical protein
MVTTKGRLSVTDAVLLNEFPSCIAKVIMGQQVTGVVTMMWLLFGGVRTNLLWFAGSIVWVLGSSIFGL